MRADLHAELRVTANAVTKSHLRRLVALGVSWPTIGELGRHHYGLGVVAASEEPGGFYVPNGEGPLRLVLPVYEDGALVDLVAFRSDDPAHWLLRTGNGWALGLERGLGVLRHAEPLPLHATPLDWLRAGADGLCVLDWSAPELVELSDFAAVHCADATIAELLTKALTPPPHIPNISVGDIRLVA